MVDKSKWQEEFDALPDWVQKMVAAASTCIGYGGGHSSLFSGMTAAQREKHTAFQMVLAEEAYSDWFDGFCHLKDLAAAMTAPWPPPEPAPHEGVTTINIVEMVSGPDDCAFDQPCHYGHRVEDHAVYCHNEVWPNSPRKCRRNRSDFLHEDCPGFYPNMTTADAA